MNINFQSNALVLKKYKTGYKKDAAQYTGSTAVLDGKLYANGNGKLVFSNGVAEGTFTKGYFTEGSVVIDGRYEYKGQFNHAGKLHGPGMTIDNKMFEIGNYIDGCLTEGKFYNWSGELLIEGQRVVNSDGSQDISGPATIYIKKDKHVKVSLAVFDKSKVISSQFVKNITLEEYDDLAIIIGQ